MLPRYCLSDLERSLVAALITGIIFTSTFHMLIIIIIIIIIVSFMQGIHTHIPETNHVPRGYIVATILSLLFMVPIFLVPALAFWFFHVSTFRIVCAVPNMAIFCSSLTSCFPGTSLTYFLNYYYYYYYYWDRWISPQTILPTKKSDTT